MAFGGLGPPTVPILGNLHQMTAKPYLMFEKWAKQCKSRKCGYERDSNCQTGRSSQSSWVPKR